jgi:hypothetical protein
MDELHNLSELMDFLQTNKETTFGGRRIKQYAFTALVTYFHSSKTATFNTEVRVDMDAQNSGKVMMLENDQCPSDEFHLDFKPKYQEMRFDRESNILIISGASEKMGAYKVSISALGAIG